MLPGSFAGIGALAGRGQRFATCALCLLDDDRPPFHCLEGFAQAGDARGDLVGDADIDQHYVILLVVDDFVKRNGSKPTAESVTVHWRVSIA